MSDDEAWRDWAFWTGQAKAAEAGRNDDASCLPPPSRPLAVARVVAGDFTIDGTLTLRCWRGGWMRWRGSHWAEIEDRELRGALYRRLEDAEYLDTSGERKRWEPTRHKVGNVIDALGTALTHLDQAQNPPAWLTSQDNAMPPGQVVSCANGLLNVANRTLMPHTPDFFGLVSVPFNYDADALEPTRWLAFLEQLWPDDPESIAALQEWFGYVLSGRTDAHKVFLLVGPTRSGKGTVARVLTALVGRDNAAGPTLASLGTNFGLSPLLGQPLAIVSDASLGGANVPQVVERLLSVSGEDMLTVDRK
jgi:putative DNA primase/helicase